MKVGTVYHKGNEYSHIYRIDDEFVYYEFFKVKDHEYDGPLFLSPLNKFKLTNHSYFNGWRRLEKEEGDKLMTEYRKILIKSKLNLMNGKT